MNLKWVTRGTTNPEERKWYRKYHIEAIMDDINFTATCRKDPVRPWWKVSVILGRHFNFDIPREVRLTDKKFNEIINQKLEDPMFKTLLLNVIFHL